MGAKAPSKLKLRRPTYKCQSCSKKFLSTQALKSHQYCVHKIKENTRPARQKASKLTNLVVKAVKNPKSSAEMVEIESKEEVQKSIAAEDENIRPVSDRRIEFECPQCLKKFTVYFSAHKHIQKFHCINLQGRKVNPNSPDLLKPVRVELCTKCNCRLRANEHHMCSDSSVDSNILSLTCLCSGCKQQFPTIQMFDLHISGLHCEGIEGMFFPTMNEFMSWKSDMESETSTKYLILNKCATKQILHCAHFLNDNKDDIPGFYRLCPSSIILREYSKGVQVHFYKQHHGHPTLEYVISKKYSKYAITSLMDKETNLQLTGIDLSDDTDLYVQFKTLMDNIVLDAAKVKINHLKILIGKALEMSTILKQYSGDDDSDENQKLHLNKSMTDNEITLALESATKDNKRKKEPIVYSNKSKSGSPAIGLKRQKVDFKESKKESLPTTLQPKENTTVTLPVKVYKNNNKLNTPTIVNAYSLADEAPIETNVQTRSKTAVNDATDPLNIYNPSKVNQMVLSPTTISSFNDSYREFVDKNFVPKKDTPKQNNMNSKIKVLSKNELNEKHDHTITIGINANNNFITKKPIDKNNSLINDSKDVDSSKILVDNDKKSVDNLKKTIDNGKKSFDSGKKTVGNGKKTADNISKTADNGKKTIDHGKNVVDDTMETIDNEKKTVDNTKNRNGSKAQEKSNTIKKEQTAKKGNAIIKAKNQKIVAGNKRKIDNKKKIMKTKIGQFRPSLSPKKPEASTSVINTSLNSSQSKKKPDFEYEVKEQENDCNILILKI